MLNILAAVALFVGVGSTVTAVSFDEIEAEAKAVEVCEDVSYLAAE